jgi:hypothetical protein
MDRVELRLVVSATATGGFGLLPDGDPIASGTNLNPTKVRNTAFDELRFGSIGSDASVGSTVFFENVLVSALPKERLTRSKDASGGASLGVIARCGSSLRPRAHQ